MDNDQNEISETIITQGNIETSTQQNNETEGDMQQSQQQQQLHRGVKRDVDELNSSSSDHEDVEDSKIGIKPGKKTRGRVKIKMEYIDNKLRRYTTFSKRKTGIMKKAYELSTLTGTQVMLLVASETGHVYTFATRKLQPMITSESGKALIQTCLNSPDPALNTVALDQRMSATGYEEPDLSYSSHETAVNGDKDGKASIFLNQNIDLNQAGSGSMTGITLQTAGNGSFPMTTYLPPSTTQALNASKSGVQSLSVQTVHGAGYATIFSPPGATFPNGAYQLGSGGQQPLPQVVNPHLHRMQAATTSANSHMDSTVTSHNHHGSPEHAGGESPGHHRHMSGVPINVLSMPGNESSQNNAAVYTSGNMPLIYNSGSLLYATPPTTQNDGDSSVQSHIVMHDGNIVTNQGIPVSLQHVPTQLQVHQEYSNSLQHHSNGMHDNHNSTNEMVGLVDPSSLTVHAEGAMEKNMGSHK